MEYYAVTKNDSDELTHWKYVKKKKVNGKWRYYYDVKDALGYDERANAAASIREYNKATQNLKDYKAIRDDPTRQKWYDFNREDELADERGRRGDIAKRAIAKYYKTPLGRLDRIDDVIDTGRNIIADLLSKASSKIRAKDESDFHLKY